MLEFATRRDRAAPAGENAKTIMSDDFRAARSVVEA